MLDKLLACPNCHGKLRFLKVFQCVSCGSKYPIYRDIPLFAQPDNLSKVLKNSQFSYNLLHQKPWDQLHDGSNEILAAFARGNKTLDIACGDGYVEKFAPETIGLDFSLNALLKAKKNGAGYLIQAIAENLPFKDNAFDLVICNGSLEHFADPLTAIAEMSRVSRIQVLTVHASVPGHNLISRLLRVKHQPIEKPIGMKKLESMLKQHKLQVVFKGVWTLPLNYGRVIKFLPVLSGIPSTTFIISFKK